MVCRKWLMGFSSWEFLALGVRMVVVHSVREGFSLLSFLGFFLCPILALFIEQFKTRSQFFRICELGSVCVILVWFCNLLLEIEDSTTFCHNREDKQGGGQMKMKWLAVWFKLPAPVFNFSAFKMYSFFFISLKYLFITIIWMVENKGN